MIWVIIENDIIINRVVCDSAEFAQAQGWEPDNNYGIGWIRSADTFAPVEN